MTLTDDYAWMKKKGTPELEAHLAAENAYTDAVLRPLKPLHDTLVGELRGRLLEDDDSARWPMRGYEYWSRERKGLAYDVVLRAPRDGGPEEVVVDLNAEADGGTFVSLGALDVSDDDARLAWTVDRSGLREYELTVRSLPDGRVLDAPIPHVTAVTWAADGKTLFYVVENDAKRPYRLYRHTVGSPPAKDVLVYEERDERFDLDVGRTSSGASSSATAAASPRPSRASSTRRRPPRRSASSGRAWPSACTTSRTTASASWCASTTPAGTTASCPCPSPRRRRSPWRWCPSATT